MDFLVKNGIDAKTHYSIAIHKQAGYPWGKKARIVGSVANAEANAATCVSLPMFPELTAEGSGLRHRQGEGMGQAVRLPGPGWQRSCQAGAAAAAASSIELDSERAPRDFSRGARFHTSPDTQSRNSRYITL